MPSQSPLLATPSRYRSTAYSARRFRSSVTGPALGVLLAVLGAPTAFAAPNLPAGLGATEAKSAANRVWTLADIVEVTRITSVAISADGTRRAFILKQPSLALGDSRYALYVQAEQGQARKVAEGPFLGDLQARPGRAAWSLRADFGDGVQVYEIDDAGRRKPCVVHHPLSQVGGDDSLVLSASQPARATGVLAYGWSPDGAHVWYAVLQTGSAEARQAWREQGLTYQDGQTTAADFYAGPPALAVELRLRTAANGDDRLIAQAAGDRFSAAAAFQGGAVSWRGSTSLIYRQETHSQEGQPSEALWRYDVASHQAHPLASGADIGALASVAAGGGELALAATDGGGHHLFKTDGAGGRTDLGAVPYSTLGGALGAWRNPAGQALFGVRQADRLGLIGYPAQTPLTQSPESLHPCAFDADLRLGICGRESLTLAPELVEVTRASGAVRVLARPNARYDAIAPLHSQPALWTNRLGTRNTGYITYPRDYQPGHSYPAVVITHAADARNLFAAETFQWAFPVQVFAERGFVVLSVNETPGDLSVSQAYGRAQSDVDPARMRAGMGLDAVASMEAAVTDAVARGLVDRHRVGIAGYSRGGIVSTLVLSQSKMFRAGINADTSFFSAGGFYRGGMVRELYRGLFGGAPLDPRYAPAYRAFSPSARADQFAGPLLQMFTGRVAPTALELDQALREAKVPTRLIVYPGETHILNRPRTILAAMQASLDWFEVWLAPNGAVKGAAMADATTRANAGAQTAP